MFCTCQGYHGSLVITPTALLYILASPRSNLHKTYTHARFAKIHSLLDVHWRAKFFLHFRQQRPGRRKRHNDDDKDDNNNNNNNSNHNQQPTTNNQQPTTNQQQPTNNNTDPLFSATSMCRRATLRLKTCQQHPQSTNVCLWVSCLPDWRCRTCHLRGFQSPRQRWRMRTESSLVERQWRSSCTRWSTDHTFDIPYFQGVSTARNKRTLAVTVTLAVKKTGKWMKREVWTDTVILSVLFKRKDQTKQSARRWLVQCLCGKSQPLLIHPITDQIPGAIG